MAADFEMTCWFSNYSGSRRKPTSWLQSWDEADTEESQRYHCPLLSERFRYKESLFWDRHATCCCGEPAHARDGHEWVSATHTPPQPTQQ
ncbi:MAG: hypothetical protein A07HR60_02247 [uncultured archaeon A07HR60]|nr:MAG: hypothetical protein A07HR60_02247 [uncultured archaeon A07HR60]